MIKLIPRVENSKAMILLSPLLALTLTAVSALIIFIFILDDIKVSSVFFTLFVLPLTDSYLFPELLVKAAPLMIIGLGLSIGFRAGIWNIGAEGQYVIGGITGGAVGLYFYNVEEVIFSELSPRPHDTGLVTLISQNLNEFELHLRAVLGIPIPEIVCHEASASRVILASQKTSNIAFTGLEDALSQPNTGVFIFGKPSSTEGRRMGVAVANAETIDEAKNKADKAAQSVQFINE